MGAPAESWATARKIEVSLIFTRRLALQALSVATADYCNVTASSVFGRRPDKANETFCINTGVVLRANAGDENDIAWMQQEAS